jgi:hypothetical protein
MIPSSVPDLTFIADIKLNSGVRLRVTLSALGSDHRTLPSSGSSLAAPPSDHIPRAGAVFIGETRLSVKDGGFNNNADPKHY